MHNPPRKVFRLPKRSMDCRIKSGNDERMEQGVGRTLNARIQKGDDMAILAMFEVEGSTAEKYDEVIRRLTQLNLRVPDGQMYHICYGDKQRLQVINVYENEAKLEAFGAKLMPILLDMNITAKPQIFEIYNIIVG